MPDLQKHLPPKAPLAAGRANLLPALLVIIAVSALCIFISKPLGPWNVIFANSGLYIDLLALLFLVFMLWNSAKVRMSHVAVNWVRYGLLLWIASAVLGPIYELITRLPV